MNPTERTSSLETLDETACRRLLYRKLIGRLAWVEDGDDLVIVRSSTCSIAARC